MRTLLLGLVTSFALAAQAPQGDLSLRGTVVNSVTGEPIKGAVVTLAPEINPDAGGAVQAPIHPEPIPWSGDSSTGAHGEFHFTGLAPGPYVFSAYKPGFVQVLDWPESSGLISLSHSLSGQTIRLTPLGIVEGNVTNQYGDPLSGVTISVVERCVEDGIRSIRQVSQASTNDRGEFRIWDLAPGKYYLQARRPASGDFVDVGEKSVRYSPWEGFRAIYFGGAYSLDSATLVAVAAGAEVRADFAVTMEPAYKVHGTLRNFTRGEPASFEWLEPGSNTATGGTPGASVVDEDTGQFYLDGVLPGEYTLAVSQPGSAGGETTVHVKDGDVKGVQVALTPYIAITGTVHLDGASPAPPEDPPASGGPPQVEPRVIPCFVHLLSESRIHDYQLAAHAVPGAEFSIGNVGPGRYRLQILCPGRYVASAVSGGADLLSNPEISVQPGGNIPPIEIDIKTGGGNLSGVIQTGGAIQTGSAPVGTGVLLVPEFAPSAGPAVQPAVRLPGTPDKLQFAFSGLAPGSYRVYAFSDVQSLEFRNPGFLNTLTGGKSVRIEGGKDSAITLASLVK